MQIPVACCILDDKAENPYTPTDTTCVTNPTGENSYMTGCFAEVNDLLDNEIHIVIVVVVCVAAVELIAAVFALCLCQAAGREQDYASHYKY